MPAIDTKKIPNLLHKLNSTEDTLNEVTRDVEVADDFTPFNALGVVGSIPRDRTVPRNYLIDERVNFAYESSLSQMKKGAAMNFALALGALVASYIGQQTGRKPGFTFSIDITKGFCGVTEDLAVMMFGDKDGKEAWQYLLKVAKYANEHYKDEKDD